VKSWGHLHGEKQDWMTWYSQSLGFWENKSGRTRQGSCEDVKMRVYKWSFQGFSSQEGAQWPSRQNGRGKRAHSGGKDHMGIQRWSWILVLCCFLTLFLFSLAVLGIELRASCFLDEPYR
jgi:hypothetical protein